MKTGGTYRLTIHDRCRNFNLDRFLVVHEDVGIREAHRKNPKESPLVDGPTGSKIAEPEERLLTDKEGWTSLTKLLSKDGDKL